MVRGPMALFGAIIAVGLGPALWLGAQFGHIAVDPTAPLPAITTDAGRESAPGGAGAAVDDTGLKAQLESPQRVADESADRDLVPLSSTPSVRPSRKVPRVDPAPSRSRSGSPTLPDPSPSRSSASPSTPPTESTTAPEATPSEPEAEVPSTPADTPTTDGGTPTDAVTQLPLDDTRST